MFEQAVLTVYGIVWGPILLALLLGTGIYLTLGLKGMTIRKIPYAFRQLLKGRKGSGEGEVTPFNALMTSLSSTVGTGNIAGVATAISLGGPGALFWMWLTALVGMATKYAEAVLAVNYRETDERGKKVGGPMYYIKNGLTKTGNSSVFCLPFLVLSPVLVWPIPCSLTKCLKFWRKIILFLLTTAVLLWLFW